MDKKDIEKKGFEVSFFVGSGPGGQHRNRTQSACRIKHTATGITVTNEDTRVQRQNMERAYTAILKQLEDEKQVAIAMRMQQYRKAALDRGRIRTYDFKRGVVKNELTGKEAPLKDVLNGKIELLQ